MARKRYLSSGSEPDSSGSDPDWSPSKGSSSGTSPTPKKTKSTRGPDTDSSTKKRAAAKRTGNSITPRRQAVSREIFPDVDKGRLSPGIVIKQELDISGLGSKWLLCEFCKKKKFDRPGRLEQHQKRCQKQVQLFHEIVEQLQNKELRIPARVCFACQQAFVNASHLRRHNRRIHGDPYYEEDIRTESKRVLKQKPRDRKPYPCSHCGKNCHRADRVQPHERRCAKNKRKSVELKKCPKCDKTFASSAFLKRHEEVCYKQVRNSLCQTCGKSFKDDATLRSHQVIHTGNKPFACQLCDMKFYKSNDLKKHERRHTGEKPYKCQQCDKCFARTDARNNHEKIHENEESKPFKCNRCERSFAQQNFLSNHLRTHSNETPQKCEHCDELFTSRAKLKKHVEEHVIRKFQCTECEQSFFREDRLEKHVEKEHEQKMEGDGEDAVGNTSDKQNGNITANVGEVMKENVVKTMVDFATEIDKYQEVIKDSAIETGVAQSDNQQTSEQVSCGVCAGGNEPASDGKSVLETQEQGDLDKSVEDARDEAQEAPNVNDEEGDHDYKDEDADAADANEERQGEINAEAAVDFNEKEADVHGKDGSQDEGIICVTSNASIASSTMHKDLEDNEGNDIVEEMDDLDVSADDEMEYREDEFALSVVEASSEEDEKDEVLIDETSTSGSESTGVEIIRQDDKSKEVCKRRCGMRDMIPPEIVNLPNASYDNFDVPTEVLVDYEDQHMSSTCDAECGEDECLACRNEQGTCDNDEECLGTCDNDEECLACRTEMQPRVMQYITSVAKGLKLDVKLRHELQLSSSEQTDDNADDDDSKMESCTSVSKADEDSDCGKGEGETIVKEEILSDEEEDDDDEDDEDDDEDDNDDDDDEGAEEANKHCDGSNCGETTTVIKVEHVEASADCEETTVNSNGNGDCDETHDNNEESNEDDGVDNDGDHNDTNGEANDQDSDGNDDDNGDDNDDGDECDESKDEEDGEGDDDDDDEEDSNDVNETQGNGADNSASEDNVDDCTSGSLNKIQNNNNTKDFQMAPIAASITTDAIHMVSSPDADGVTGNAGVYMEQFRETEVLQSLKELCENYEELSSEDEEMCSKSNIKSRDEIVDIIKKETEFLKGFDKDARETDNSTDSEVVIMQKNVNYNFIVENTTGSLLQKDAVENGTAEGVDGGANPEVTNASPVKKKGRPKATGDISSTSKVKKNRGRPKIVKVKTCRFCKVNFEAEFLKSHKMVCTEKPSVKKRKITMNKSGDEVDSNERTNSETGDDADVELSLPNCVAEDAEQLKETVGDQEATLHKEISFSRGVETNGEKMKNNSRKRKLSARSDVLSGHDDNIDQMRPKKQLKRPRTETGCVRSKLSCQYCRFRVQKLDRLKLHEVKCLEIKKKFEYLEKHPEVVKNSLKGRKKFRCHFCIKDCKSSQRFEQHWRLCQQRKRRINQVKSGEQVDHDYSCRYCCQQFVDENVWLNHEIDCRSLEQKYEEIMHTTPIRPVYKCKKCHKSFEKLFIWERHKKKCSKSVNKQVKKKQHLQKSSHVDKRPSTQSSVPEVFGQSLGNIRSLKRLSMDLEFDFAPPNLKSPRPSLRSTHSKPSSLASSPAKSTTSSMATSPIKSPTAKPSRRKERKNFSKRRSLDFKSKSSKDKRGGSSKDTPSSTPTKSSPSSTTPKKSALQLKSLQLKKKSLQQQQASMQMKRHSFRCRYCNEYYYNIEKLITHERKCLFLKDYSELPSQLRDHFGASFF